MRQTLARIHGILQSIGRRWGVYFLMVAGLAMAYATVVTIGLYVRDELTFDRFLPNAERLYLLQAEYGPVGQPLVASDVSPAGVARWVRSDSKDIEAVSRLVPVEWPLRSDLRFVKEKYYWADANFFDLVRLPALHGDLSRALDLPGSVVMTERMAKKYFGTSNAVGKTLATKDGFPLKVTGVLHDFPANIHLDREIFASGSADYAMLSILDHNTIYLWPTSYTYIRLKTSVRESAVARDLLHLSHKHWQGANNIPVGFKLTHIHKLHFKPQGDGQMRPRGHLNSVLALTAVAAAVLILAAINCSGLILAEAAEREIEMSLYAALGATRLRQAGYIIREAVFVNMAAALLGLAIVERMLPSVNDKIGMSLNLWDTPFTIIVSLLVLVGMVGLLCGLYPALRLSRIIQNGFWATSHHTSERWLGWVTLQLVLVIVLFIASHTMSRQWDFAFNEALNFNGRDVLMVRLIDNEYINDRFRKSVRNVEGIELVAESFGVPTTEFVRPGWIRKPTGGVISFTRNSVNPDFFNVFKVPIIAGRNLSGTYSEPEVPREIIVNLAAAKALGFRNPEQALNQIIAYETDRTSYSSTIVGVVPDLRFTTVYEPSHPMIFDGFSKYFTQVNLRLARKDDEVLRQIDAHWRDAASGSVPIERQFYRDYLSAQYHDLYQQLWAFTLVSTVAVVMSVLGLTGLCIFLARHQRHEMAVRRALGATFSDLLKQRLSPFWGPLCLANLIAWPLAGFALNVWLMSFEAHVAIAAHSFLIASAMVTCIAILTLILHSGLTMLQTPMKILRR